MTTPRIIPQERAPRAELVAIAEKDIAEVACFIAAQSGRSAETVESHLRWFLLENPARRSGRSAGLWTAFRWRTRRMHSVQPAGLPLRE